MLADATPEVAATLGDLQVAILRSNIRRFAPPFNISQAFRLYYFQQKTTGFYTRGLMLLYLETDYFKNINSA
jgi:hypothetical protein